jgi:hypothetical protein
MPEATEDKQNANEALQAISQFTGQMYPFVERGNLDFKVFKEMLAGFMRYYKFGAALEGAIDSLVQPPPPPPMPQDNSIQVKQLELQGKQASEQAAQQFESQKMQIEMQAEQQKLDYDMQMEQAKLETQRIIDEATRESQRMIEQAKAATQIHIKQMEVDAQRSIAEYQATMNYNLQIELESMRLGMEQAKQDNELQRLAVSEQAMTDRQTESNDLDLLKHATSIQAQDKDHGL